MTGETLADEPDEEALGEAYGEEILDRLVVEEMGDEIAAAMRRARRDQEALYRRTHPDEGLRERKRRLTRLMISDAATTMFATRGFDNVKVSEVAERVGVSEKTIYNYFPTKESMVLDNADEAVEDMARALRDRRPGESLTEVVVRALEADMQRFDAAPDELMRFVPMFLQMIENTPALRAAWLDLHDRLALVARDELAAQAGVDPRDPEPTLAGRALVGLAQVALDSRVRHIVDGLRGEELRRAANADVERAARLLETGLWSFSLLARGSRATGSAREAAQAAEQARAQVVAALQQARAAWAEVRRQGLAAAQEARSAAREARNAQREAHHAARRRPPR